MSNQKWADQQDAEILRGVEIVKAASNEALEYIQDVLENLNDQAWRRMVVETQALEMGVGEAIAEHLVPVIYKDMPKRFVKVGKLPKAQAEMLKRIYIGRVIKNIRKELP